MKLQILSDLHIEFALFEPPKTNADVVILAGDIHIGEKGFDWAMENFKNQEVIYVLGNHEYYHQAIPKLTEKLRTRAKGTNVHILENEALTICDIRFSGCTLWSDFKLFGNPDVSVAVARDMMNDYRLIRLSPEYKRIQPSYTAVWHNKSRSWLEKEIKNCTNKKKVVITHHAPSILSVPAIYKNDHLSAAFASDMDGFVSAMGPDLWVHGHIHGSSDYHIGSTRVVCNPRGYPDENISGFRPEFITEV